MEEYYFIKVKEKRPIFKLQILKIYIFEQMIKG